MPIQGAPDIRKLFDLTGRVAVITGAGSGFGEAVALGLAEFGCDIVCADVDVARAQVTALQVEKKGRNVLVERMDVGDPEQIRSGFRDAAERFGRFDVLVNSAGVS